eukprot:1137306-Pelagomonas_calceolata.AAC.2
MVGMVRYEKHEEEQVWQCRPVDPLATWNVHMNNSLKGKKWWPCSLKVDTTLHNWEVQRVSQVFFGSARKKLSNLSGLPDLPFKNLGFVVLKKSQARG